jgi:hypothetical protein
MRSAHGANLFAIVHYGGAVTDAELGAITGLRMLVVLNNVSPADLRLTRDAFHEWTDAGNPPPVYFSRAEIADAADVFPIEFLDMMENRRIVHGSDPFVGLEVARSHLRHQVEFELRGKLLRLRELYIRSSATPELITPVLVSSLGTFAKFFRFALDLVGAEAPASRRQAVAAAIRVFALDPKPFETILGALGSGEGLGEAEAHQCFADYVLQIERVIAAVDRLPDE